MLAGAGVTNTGPSVVQGDLGSSPNIAVSGFPPGLVQSGTINPSYTAGAKDALVTAYDDASGRTPVTTIATELGNQTLTHGVYDSAAGTFGITGTLTLDAQNDPNAVWIFRAASTLITGVGSSVSLINGANPCNIFWVVGSSATLGVDSTFSGTIMSLTSITMNSGATLNGRALARNGAVTLSSNVISNSCTTAGPGASPSPGPAPAPGVAVTKTASPASLAEPGGAFTFTVAVTNPSAGAVTISSITDNVYGNLASAANSTCSGLIGGVLAAGGGTTCTFTGTFTGNAADTETDIVTATVTSPSGLTASATDDATVTLTDVVPTITVDKSVDRGTRAEPGGLFTFTVTVTNTSPEVVRITSIVDNLYGDLAAVRSDSNCSDGFDMSLAPVSEPNNSFTCTLSVLALGRDGAEETDRVTATAVDDEANVATASDEATISITAPAIRRNRRAAIVPGLVVQPPAPPALLPVITQPAAQALLPITSPQAVVAPPAVGVPAPSGAVATPTARKTHARTGSSSLPLLVLACNMIVLGLLLNSRMAGRRRYLS